MANLKDKIQDLLKNTTSNEIKALCESYLKETSSKDIEGSDKLTENLFTGLKTLVSKDSNVAKLLSETESYNKTKMDLETNISKNAAQRLMDNWDSVRRDKKISNVGTDNTLKMENENKAKQHEMLLESIASLAGEDAAAKAMVSNINKNNYRVAESLEKIKKSQIANHPNLKYVIARYENALSEGTAEYKLVKDFLASIHPFKWDSVIRESYDVVQSVINDRAAEIEVQNVMETIKSTDGKRFYSDLIKKMNEWVSSENRNIHDLIREMKGYSFNPLVKDLSNRLMLMENTKGTTFNIPVKNSNCSIQKIYSPVMETESGRVFKAGTNYYHSTPTSLKRLSEKQVNALPVKFTTLCEDFSTAKVVDDKITLFMGKAKIQIYEDKRIFINEKQIDPSTLGTQLLYHTQINVFAKTSDLINRIVNVYENIDNICEIDYGKSIISNVFEGVGVFIFKKEDKLFINKVNNSMNENGFYEANAIQAVNMVKEFLSYNLSESLGEFLEGDHKQKAGMEKEAQSILNNIKIVENDLDNIDSAILKDPSLGDVEEIQEAKSLLENELNNLKASWQIVCGRITRFEKLVKEGEEEESEEEIKEIPDEESKEEVIEEPAEAEGEETSAEPVGEEPAAEPAEEVAPAAQSNDVVAVGALGAEGSQNADIKGNDNMEVVGGSTAAQEAPGGEEGGVAPAAAGMVDTGFAGMEGAQSAAPTAASDAIKTSFPEQTIVTPGEQPAGVVAAAPTAEVKVAAGNEEPAAAEVEVEVAGGEASAINNEEPAAAGEEPAEPVAAEETPAEGEETEGEEAEEESEEEDGEKKNKKVEENKEEVNEEIEVDSKVKVLSRNAEGTVTAINDGEYTVLLDGGESIPCKQSDLQSLTDEIEAQVAKNEKEVSNEGKEEGVEVEGTDKEQKDDTQEIMYVKASLTIDLGPFKQGDGVEIDASAYTAGGDDDPVKLKSPKEGVSEIPKKYLKLSDEATSPAEEMSDIQLKTESMIKSLEELETIVKQGDKINDKAIEAAKTKLKRFVEALNKETTQVPSEE